MHQKSGGVVKVNVTVSMSMDLTNFLKVDETQDIFETKLMLHLTWLDSRLKFNNLKVDSNKNMMANDERYQIWSPPALFENTKKSERIVNDELASASIERMGDFEVIGSEVLDNTHVFLGEQNPITLSRIFQYEFICIYQMAWYPFDTQRCKIVVTLAGNADLMMKLQPGKLNYLGPKDLTQYFIKDSKIQNGTRSNKPVVYVEVTLGRRLLSTILTVYLPTILLNVIGFATNFFKVRNILIFKSMFCFRIFSLKPLLRLTLQPCLSSRQCLLA